MFFCSVANFKSKQHLCITARGNENSPVARFPENVHHPRRNNDCLIEESTPPTRLQIKKPDCCLCRKDHPLRKCIKFNKMTVPERRNVVQRYRYCINCLAHSHRIQKCRSFERCNRCKGQHHTLLHSAENSRTQETLRRPGSTTVVPTVIIKIRLNNEWGQVRGLLNPCAANSFIAAFLVERYGLPFEQRNEAKWCTFTFRTRFEEETVTFTVTALITKDLPEKPQPKSLDRSITNAYRNIRLADPDFFESNSMNFVLGADIYPRLIRSGLQISAVGGPVAQDTELGWVITGKFGD